MDQANLETAKLTFLEAKTNYSNQLEHFVDAHYSDWVSLESRIEMIRELMNDDGHVSREEILEVIVKNHC